MDGGTVPLATLPGTIIPPQQQPQQTATSVLQQLMGERSAIDTQLQQLTKGGAVPTSAAPALPSPGLLLNPVQQHQDLPMDEREVVGRHAAKLQGIGNAVSAAANVVGRFTEKIQQNKQRTLAVDLERVLTSVQGLQQARDVLQTDPNNAQAKQTIEKNTEILNALLSDPKKQKQIAKALDINFTDPEQNKTPEHDALKQATKSFADQLQAQIPQQMQVNPQALQQIQMLVQRQQGIDKMISAVVPAEIRTQATRDISDQRFQESLNKLQFESEKTNAEINARWQETQARIAAMRDASQARIAAMRDASQARIAAAWGMKQYGEQMANARLITGLQLRESLIEHRGLSGDKAIAADQKTLKLALTAQTNATEFINKTKQLRDQIQKDKGNKNLEYYKKNDPDTYGLLQTYNESIHTAEIQLKDSTDAVNRLQHKLGGKGGTISGTSTEPSGDTSPTGGTFKTESRFFETLPTVGATADSDGEEDNSDLF